MDRSDSVIGAFALLAAASAMVFALNFRGGLNDLPLFLSFMSLLAWALLLAQWSANRSVRHSAINWAVGLFLVALLAGWRLSLAPAISLQVIATVSAMPLGYFLTRHSLSRGMDWCLLDRLLSVVGAILSVSALAEFALTRNRTTTTFLDFNAFAAFLNIIILIRYSELIPLLRERGSVRQLVGKLSLFGLLVAALATTQSLGGLLCLLAALLGLSLSANGKSASAWGLTILSAAIVTLGYLAASRIQGMPSEALQRLASAGSHSSFTERLAMWSSALAIYGDHHWWGVGLGMFKVLYPAYRNSAEVSTSGDMVHNDYVQFLLEGGPQLLLPAIALPALLLVRLWQQGLAKGRLGQLPDYVRLGTGFAALAPMAHACINFIYYVLPLGLMIGICLARADFSTDGVHSQPAPSPKRRPATMALLGLGFGLVLSIGSRALFEQLAFKKCDWRACEVHLERDPKLVLDIAFFVAATQPGWLPARDFIVEQYRGLSARSDDDSLRLLYADLAVGEQLAIIKELPQAGYTYRVLGDIVLQSPESARLIPAELPSTAVDLYDAAVRRNPLDFDAAISLSAQLDRAGRTLEAFERLDVDAMRWWKHPIIGDFNKRRLLDAMLPLAIKLGRCNDAQGIARGLQAYKVESPQISALLKMPPKAIPAVQGCGLPTAQPQLGK